MKTCSKCGIEKPITDFVSDQRSKDGAKSYCLKCNRESHHMSKEKDRERLKIWRASNPEKSKGYDRKYLLQGNRRETIEAWRRNNPEKIKAYKRSRNYLERHGVGKICLSEWENILKTYNNKCLCCGTKEDITADHIVPLSKGGANTIQNIQPLCRKCNSSKGLQEIDYRNKILQNESFE